MPVSGSPFQDAVAQSQADPAAGAPIDGQFGELQAGSFDPAASPVPLPKFHAGSATQIGRIRDQLMDTFPGVNTIEDAELEMSAAQKIGFFAHALTNPQGALDLVRQRQQRHLKRKARAAAMNMKMLEVSKGMIDSQNDLEAKMFTAKIEAARAEREDRRLEFQEEIQQGQLDVQEANLAISKQQEERAGEQAGIQKTMLERFGATPPTSGFTNPETGEMGGQTFVPGVEGEGAVGGEKFSPTFRFGPRGLSTTLSPRDPQGEEFKQFNAFMQTKFRGKIGVITPQEREEALTEFRALLQQFRGGGAPGGRGFSEGTSTELPSFQQQGVIQ